MGRAAEEYLVAIDLGSSTTRCAVASWRPGKEPLLEGYGEAPSRGVAKGLVVDAAAAAQGLQAAVAAAGTVARVKIATVLAAVATPHARGLNSRGCIGIAHEDKVVRGDEATRALSAANRIALPSDRAVTEVFTQGFAVDDLRGIHNPVGLAGGRLEAEIHIVTDALAGHDNVRQLLRANRLKLERVVFGPIAAAEAVLTEEEKRLGAVHIDVGAGTTSLALYCGGYPRFSRVLPIGCLHIASDVAIGLNTSVAEAATLVRRYGIPAGRRPRRRADSPRIEVTPADGWAAQTVPLWRLGVIVRARVEEIFELVRKELGRSGLAVGACARAVLTGGFCHIDGALAAAKRALRRSVRFGAVAIESTHGPFEADPAHAVVLGSLLRGMVIREEKFDRRFEVGGWRGLYRRVAGWF